MFVSWLTLRKLVSCSSDLPDLDLSYPMDYDVDHQLIIDCALIVLLAFMQ